MLPVELGSGAWGRKNEQPKAKGVDFLGQRRLPHCSVEVRDHLDEFGKILDDERAFARERRARLTPTIAVTRSARGLIRCVSRASRCASCWGSQVTRFVGDVLVRMLFQSLPNGWPAVVDDESRFAVAKALGRWSGYTPETHQDRANQVMEALRATPPPPSWRPLGPDDELLRTLLPDEET